MSDNRNNGKRKLQVRFAVCLLFLCLWGILSSCACGAGSGAEPSAGTESGAEASATAEGGLDVWFFACTEDADSILLQSGGRNVMIDTGIEEDAAAMIEKLEALQVEEIDLLILTHPDKDHIGGASLLLDTFPVEEVIRTSYEKGSALQEELDRKLEQENVAVPDEKQELAFEKLLLTVYPPEEIYEDSNNCSIAVLAVYEDKKFFFAGDAKKKRIEELLDEELPQVDVYKAAHHGRDNGKSDDLVRRLRPAYVVVTAPETEEKTKAALQEVGAEIYSTCKKDVHFTVVDGILDVE